LICEFFLFCLREKKSFVKGQPGGIYPWLQAPLHASINFHAISGHARAFSKPEI
jgi:hypothetical protein